MPVVGVRGQFLTLKRAALFTQKPFRLPTSRLLILRRCKPCTAGRSRGAWSEKTLSIWLRTRNVGRIKAVWPINASLIFLLAATGLSGSAKSQGETPVLLKDWQSLPDLFELARLKMKDGDVYREQARIEKEYRAKHLPFRTTRNFRHQVSCSTKEHWSGAAEFHLVNSKGETLTITREDLHEVEQHGADFPPKVAAFLRELSPALPHADLALVAFPGPIAVEEDVHGAYDEAPPHDPRWEVAKELQFVAPTQAVVTRGPLGNVSIKAMLANPTAHPIPVVLWQAESLNPLYVQVVEDHFVKRKPPNANTPPMPPPVPLPPIRIAVPPRHASSFKQRSTFRRMPSLKMPR